MNDHARTMNGTVLPIEIMMMMIICYFRNKLLIFITTSMKSSPFVWMIGSYSKGQSFPCTQRSSRPRPSAEAHTAFTYLIQSERESTEPFLLIILYYDQTPQQQLGIGQFTNSASIEDEIDERLWMSDWQLNFSSFCYLNNKFSLIV